MKTRIIHTQFWDDSYILKLSPKEKLLFVFYFTNSKCGQTPYYEISSEVTKLVTGLSLKEINDYKTRFQADRKYIFVDDWVYIVNAEKYQNYKGEKNEKAYDNEYLLIPQQIKEKVNTLLKEIDSVSIVYPYPMDTTINHKSEIINHKSEIINRDFNKIEDITNSVLQEISEKYEVPIGFVENCWDTAQNWLESSGKTKKNYKAFLSNWVKSEKGKEVQNGKPRAIDAERIIRERKMGSQSEQRSLHA